ncbi:hypothetical protein [Streptomyces sp. NBC_00207]|uniref:hypothetical protein n=1 Tax=Streptomyces sp. NBC_00207 TaxID=2903635 RepID=UPI003255CF93
MTDTCPNCLERDIEPALERRRGQTTRDGYQCPHCRQQWVVMRHQPSYLTASESEGEQIA